MYEVWCDREFFITNETNYKKKKKIVSKMDVKIIIF